jgi:hypothetical protein
MKSLNRQIAGMLLACVVTVRCRSSSLFADDYPARQLSDEDRRTLDEYLGNGVVGEAVAAPALPDGLGDLISIRDGLAWRMRVISGKGKGTVQKASAGILDRPGDKTRFRIDTGDGRDVLFGQTDPKGNLISYATQDNQQGVITRFTPAQPIFLAGMKPGESQKFTSTIFVGDLSAPDVETHSGKFDVEFTYEGAYKLHVPAGTIDAVLFKTRLNGKVGPASVQDTIYRFFAKKSGFVAEVETEDVSAALIYHEKTRVGKVLVQTEAK